MNAIPEPPSTQNIIVDKLVWKTQPMLKRDEIIVDHIDLRYGPGRASVAFLMASKPDPLAGSYATDNSVRA
ncbi:hypothetical protein BPAE_0057g00470 [Botrytis paeoniae]|uniref:Uncharacterized protein n=1 Tax=Botrytis paeoniae TaxID=278948 RepID=A0A4Z1FXY0_9HELO|nr:hypothetical protein BPAE_0057g00470 [Botrytis paeoniae]